MTKIVTVYNQKGGVGKTTLAVNLAHALGRTGEAVVLMDLANPPYCHEWLGVPADNSALHWLKGEDVNPVQTRLGIGALTGYRPGVAELLGGKIEVLTAEMIRRERIEALGADVVVIDGYRYEYGIEHELLGISDVVLIPHHPWTPLDSTQSTLGMCAELRQEGWRGKYFMIGWIERVKDAEGHFEMGRQADGVMLMSWIERVRQRRRATVFEAPRVGQLVVEYHNLAMWLKEAMG